MCTKAKCESTFAIVFLICTSILEVVDTLIAIIEFCTETNLTVRFNVIFGIYPVRLMPLYDKP